MTSHTTSDAGPQGGPSRELLEALGWLSVAYSGLEAKIAVGIWRMVDEKGTFKGAAITAGRRLLDLADLYVALAKMGAPQAATEFGELRSRLDSVNARRNRFVHSAWSVAPGTDTDARFSFKVRGGKGFKFKLELTDPAEVRTVGDDAVGLTEEIAEITQRCIETGKQSSA